jgi:phage minor structural protein
VIFVLNNKEVILGVLDNSTPFSCPYEDDLHVENIVSGVHTYEFSVPANHETAGLIEADGYVIIKDLDNRMQMFQIKEINTVSNSEGINKEVYCEHIAVPELLGNVVRPVLLKSYTLENAVKYVLDGTGWELGNFEYLYSKDVKFEDYVTVLEALLTIVEQFETEIQYEIVYSNGIVTKRIVHVVKRRGEETKKWFTYGKDLEEVSRKENSEGIVTALIGLGKGDSGGERVTLTGYTSSLPEGYSKPVEADWIGNDEALQRYGKNGKHIFGVLMVDEAENKEVIFDAVLEELKTRSKPNVSYSMSVATLERISGYEADKVRVGDTILGKDTEFIPELVLEARIIELKRSYTNPENDSLTLGDYRPIKIATDSSLLKIQKLISANEERWKALPYNIYIHSTGGDIFKNGNGSTTLTAKVYQGGIEKDIDGTIYNYKWKKLDANGNEISTFSKTGKSIALTDTDISLKNTFSVEVESIT